MTLKDLGLKVWQTTKKAFLIFKPVIEVLVGILAALFVVKTVGDKLSVKKNSSTVDSAKKTVDKVTSVVAKNEVKTVQIEKEHNQVVTDKKVRDEKAKKYLPDL